MSGGGWIGVDFDGTLVTYTSWNGGGIGAPVPAMVERVRGWLAEGRDVRIVTARVAGDPDDAVHQRELVAAWCIEHLGRELPVTCRKDYSLVELWDDRAVQVVPNEGRRVDEAAAARAIGIVRLMYLRASVRSGRRNALREAESALRAAFPGVEPDFPTPRDAGFAEAFGS